MATKTERSEAAIADLEQAEREAFRLYSAASAIAARLGREHAQAEIALAEARGEAEHAAYLRLLADPDATPQEKHDAYVRRQARNALRASDPEVVLSVLSKSERAEVAAEVERMRAAEVETPVGEALDGGAGDAP